MAPEQAMAKNEQINSSTDVFALGVIAFEMLSGSLPFRGTSTPEIVFKIVYEDPKTSRHVES